MDLVLNSILSDASTAHHPCPDILTMSVCLKYLFYPIIFSIFVSFTLNWVSCRQQIVGFWLFILLLCLLIWTFNPLTFKVFLDRYVNIPIFKLCFSVDVVVLFSFVHFFSLLLFEGFLLGYLVSYSLLLDLFLSQQFSCLILISLLLFFLVPYNSDLHFYWYSFLVPLMFLFPPFWIQLVRSVSFYVLSGDFTCSFNWEYSLCFFILLNFLYLYEFRRNSCLPWSHRGIFMWECIDCVSAIVLCKSCFQHGLPCLSSERAGCYPVIEGLIHIVISRASTGC